MFRGFCSFVLVYVFVFVFVFLFFFFFLFSFLFFLFFFFVFFLFLGVPFVQLVAWLYVVCVIADLVRFFGTFVRHQG